MAPPMPALGIAALAAFSMIPAAHADSIAIVTGRGNVFMLDPGIPGAAGSGSGIGDGAGDGTAMIDGLGVSARIIHKEYGGSMIHGRSLVGAEESMRSYVPVGAGTRFMVSALDTDPVRTVPIPAFYQSYRVGGGSAPSPGPSSPNVLGYDFVRRVSGDVSVSLHDSGIVITGSGRAIVGLLNYTGQELVVTGSLSEGTVVRMAGSPYDLGSIPYDPARGFLVYHEPVNPDTGAGPEPVQPRWRNANTPPTESRISVLVGSADDSAVTGIFEYLQEASAQWYHGKCCRGRYTTSGSFAQAVDTSLVVAAHPSGYLVVIGDRDDPSTMSIRDIARPGAKLSITNYNRVAGFDYRIYDALPAKEYRSLSGSFEEVVAMPQGARYLVVDSAGGTSSLAGAPLGGRSLVEVSGLEPGTGYRVTKEGRTVAAGITSGSGSIDLPAPGDHRSPGIGGMLHLYGGSLTHTSAEPPGTVVFDRLNSEVIPLEGSDRAYVVHAYVKVPVTGDVEISGAALDGLALPYLDGRYSTGDTIHFPVIPTYRQVHMAVNGVPTFLNIADVLGATGLKIADPVSSTITSEDPSGFVESVESTAGVISYMIAASDGSAKAHVRATVYGTSEITNTRFYQLAPPPPPPPRPVDPLTTWIEVYVNGEPRDIGGEAAAQIYFSDDPDEDHEGGSTRTSAYHTARFSYEPVTAEGTVSVPVQEGDFVEFYFYSTIRAEGSVPPVPPGFSEIRRGGTATATSVIEYASINTSL